MHQGTAGILACGSICSLCTFPFQFIRNSILVQISKPLTVAGQRGIPTLFPPFEKPELVRLLKFRVEHILSSSSCLIAMGLAIDKMIKIHFSFSF